MFLKTYFALCFIFIHLCSFEALSQDERYFRKVITGELSKAKEKNDNVKNSIRLPLYTIDLNRDAQKEGLLISKKDGIDVLEILNSYGKTLLELKLSPLAGDSTIKKVRLVSINKNTDCLMIYYFEGSTKGVNFLSRARLYLVTIEEQNLSKLSAYRGPHIWVEKQSREQIKWRRYYSVFLKDLDSDGTKEILHKYNGIDRVIKYLGKGKWKRL